MADFLTDLLNKTDSDLFKNECDDKVLLKEKIEDSLKNIKNNPTKIINDIIANGDTMAVYRFLLLELKKIDIKAVKKIISSGNFTYRIKEVKHYTKNFNRDFKIQNRDSLFYNEYFSYLFENRDKQNLQLSTLMNYFYKEYDKKNNNLKSNNQKYFDRKDRVDFSDLVKLLHFIRKGNTPLYNSQYREFFCLKDISSIADKSDPSKITKSKIDIFQKQYFFINKIFEHIIRESNQKSGSPYNFSKYFKEFNEKFYINDKGVTQHKMIDYAIWYS